MKPFTVAVAVTALAMSAQFAFAHKHKGWGCHTHRAEPVKKLGDRKSFIRTHCGNGSR